MDLESWRFISPSGDWRDIFGASRFLHFVILIQILGLFFSMHCPAGGVMACRASEAAVLSLVAIFLSLFGFFASHNAVTRRSGYGGRAELHTETPMIWSQLGWFKVSIPQRFVSRLLQKMLQNKWTSVNISEQCTSTWFFFRATKWVQSNCDWTRPSLDEVSGQQHEASHKGGREDWLLRHGGHELLRFKLPSGERLQNYSYGKSPCLIG